LRNGDHNSLNLLTRQLIDNDDIIGDIAEELNRAEREELAGILTKLLSK
jgi:hypothetical protein